MPKRWSTSPSTLHTLINCSLHHNIMRTYHWELKRTSWPTLPQHLHHYTVWLGSDWLQQPLHGTCHPWYVVVLTKQKEIFLPLDYNQTICTTIQLQIAHVANTHELINFETDNWLLISQNSKFRLHIHDNSWSMIIIHFILKSSGNLGVFSNQHFVICEKWVGHQVKCQLNPFFFPFPLTLNLWRQNT